VHTYLARIYARSGNWERAIGHLKEKLRLYGVKPERAREDVVAEMAIVWSQIGRYEMEMGRVGAAADAFLRARALDRQVENLHGEVVNTINLGSALLAVEAGAARVGPRADLKGMIERALSAHRETLRAWRERGKGYAHAETIPALKGSLMKLEVWRNGSRQQSEVRSDKRRRPRRETVKR
jgi:hypothetical protein